MKTMAITILKASGQPERFQMKKLVDSLIRSGAHPAAAKHIAGQVEQSIAPFTSTKQIYRMAKKLLRKYNHASTMRYSLKKALSLLGPSGYPFEKYFARVLQHHGYAVETNRFIDGRCARHEVDIVAAKNGRRAVVECKYHTAGGKPTDIKTALYVHSRAKDLSSAGGERHGREERIDEGWLVTNTRCTADAIQYSECAGLKIVSWRYPAHASLEQMIESRRLYPVTALPAVKKDAIKLLFQSDIILAQEIADMDEMTFYRVSGLDPKTAKAIKREADILCPCA